MTNFESVRKFMKTFGQEIKKKAQFPDDQITKLRFALIKEELEELKDAMEKKEALDKAEKASPPKPIAQD